MYIEDVNIILMVYIPSDEYKIIQYDQYLN